MLQKEEAKEAKIQSQLSSQELTAEVKLLLKRYEGHQFFCGKLEDPNPQKPCFNHACKLPIKSNKPQPLHDYQLEIIDLLEGTNIAGKNPNLDVKHFIWVKKAVGIGLSELLLRWIAFCGICHNSQFANTKCFLTCGPAERTALELVERLRGILRPLGCPSLVLESDRTICKFANFYVATVPSSNLDRLRGWTNVSMIVSDEADFYSPSEGETLREIAEYYPSKCPGIYLVLLSSPNLPLGLFDKIEHDKNAIYTKILIPYTRTIGKIYSEQEIDQARKSQGFERNFNLKYGFGVSNIFSESAISNSIVEYDRPSMQDLAGTVVSLGCDPGFGSSRFAVSAIGIISDKVTVLEAQQFERISFTHSVDVVASIMKRYGYSAYTHNVKVLIDSSRPDFLRDLKSACGEETQFETQLEYSRKYKIPLGNLMHIIPVNFGTDGRQLLSHFQGIVSDNGLQIAPRFHELIMQMRIARMKSNGMLDKTGNNTMDLLESLELAVYNVQINNRV